MHSSLPQPSEGEKNRNMLLSISATLERSDRVFLRKEEEEKLLESLESMKNLYMEAKSDIVTVHEPVSFLLQFSNLISYWLITFDL